MIKPQFTFYKVLLVFLCGALFATSSLWVSRSSALYFAFNVGPGTKTSRNWAGYVATGGPYTAVRGTWIVPTVSNSRIGADATWVGIGGVRSQDLIQSGTQALVTRAGLVTYQAWIELLPAASQPIPVVVHNGDSVTVSITEQSADHWQVSFTDTTSGQQYQTSVQYTSSLSSVEWVEEAPRGRHIVLPLDNFGTVQFSNGSAVTQGHQVTIFQAGGQAVTMLNALGRPIAVPSALTSDGAGFSVSRASVWPYDRAFRHL